MAALALYLAAVFVGGALLAPGLWHAVHAVAEGVPALEPLTRMRFSRYVNRGLLVVALVGLPFYVRAAGIRRWADVGLDPRRPSWRRLGAGFAMGFLSLAAVCGVAIAVGGRTMDLERSAADFAGRLAGALVTALVVGVIEELLFRGAFFGGMRRAMPWPAALVASSAVYAVVHFLARPPSPERIGWTSGLEALPGMLAGFGDVDALLPAGISLLLAGIVLALAYVRTGDLWASIGIHAGWIFWLKSYGWLTDAAPGAEARLWGSDRLIDGWFALFALVAVLCAVIVQGGRRAEEG